MIRIFCTVLVLACVAGLSGVLTGHLWNRYAEENGLLGLSEIHERILAAGAGFADWAAPAPSHALVREASAFEE
jgi:hypothetical protein